MSKLVSIIVNCYNGEKYLKETLKSIQNQKYNNWELIFWDNQQQITARKFLKILMILDLNIFMPKNIQHFIKQEI